jgi:hypothetical protein
MGTLAAGLAVFETFKVSGDFQKLQMGMSTLVGSDAAAEGFVSSLRQFEPTTPFTLPEEANWSRQLMAAKISIDQIIPSIKAEGDAASALGASSQDIARFNRMLMELSAGVSPGRILVNMARDIPGLNPFEILSTQLHKSIEQIKADLKSGALSNTEIRDALLKGMEAQFGGAMDKMMNTLPGQFSNFMTKVFNAAVNVGTPLIPALTSMFQGVGKALEAIGSSGIGEGLANTFKKIGPFMAPVVSGFGALLNLGLKITAWVTSNPLTSWALGAALALKAMGSAISPIFSGLSGIALALNKTFTGDGALSNMTQGYKKLQLAMHGIVEEKGVLIAKNVTQAETETGLTNAEIVHLRMSGLATKADLTAVAARDARTIATFMQTEATDLATVATTAENFAVQQSNIYGVGSVQANNAAAIAIAARAEADAAATAAASADGLAVNAETAAIAANTIGAKLAAAATTLWAGALALLESATPLIALAALAAAIYFYEKSVDSANDKTIGLSKSVNDLAQFKAYEEHVDMTSEKLRKLSAEYDELMKKTSLNHEQTQRLGTVEGQLNTTRAEAIRLIQAEGVAVDALAASNQNLIDILNKQKTVHKLQENAKQTDVDYRTDIKKVQDAWKEEGPWNDTHGSMESAATRKAHFDAAVAAARAQIEGGARMSEDLQGFVTAIEQMDVSFAKHQDAVDDLTAAKAATVNTSPDSSYDPTLDADRVGMVNDLALANQKLAEAEDRHAFNDKDKANKKKDIEDAHIKVLELQEQLDTYTALQVVLSKLDETDPEDKKKIDAANNQYNIDKLNITAKYESMKNIADATAKNAAIDAAQWAIEDKEHQAENDKKAKAEVASATRKEKAREAGILAHQDAMDFLAKEAAATSDVELTKLRGERLLSKTKEDNAYSLRDKEQEWEDRTKAIEGNENLKPSEKTQQLGQIGNERTQFTFDQSQMLRNLQLTVDAANKAAALREVKLKASLDLTSLDLSMGYALDHMKRQASFIQGQRDGVSDPLSLLSMDKSAAANQAEQTAEAAIKAFHDKWDATLASMTGDNKLHWDAWAKDSLAAIDATKQAALDGLDAEYQKTEHLLTLRKAMSDAALSDKERVLTASMDEQKRAAELQDAISGNTEASRLADIAAVRADYQANFWKIEAEYRDADAAKKIELQSQANDLIASENSKLAAIGLKGVLADLQKAKSAMDALFGISDLLKIQGFSQGIAFGRQFGAVPMGNVPSMANIPAIRAVSLANNSTQNMQAQMDVTLKGTLSVDKSGNLEVMLTPLIKKVVAAFDAVKGYGNRTLAGAH